MPGLEPTDFDQRGIGGAIGRTERGCGDHTDARWHGGEGAGRDHGIFGKSARLVAPVNAIAGLEPAIRIGLNHFAGKFQPGDEGYIGFELIVAPRHQQIREIERGGVDFYQHFARTTLGQGQVNQRATGQVERERLDLKRLHVGQNVSLAARSAAKVATASPPPQRAASAGSSARRKGLVASSRDSAVGTVGLPAARAVSICAT